MDSGCGSPPPPSTPPHRAPRAWRAGAVPGAHREEGPASDARAQILTPRESRCPPTPCGPPGTRPHHPGCLVVPASVLAGRRFCRHSGIGFATEPSGLFQPSPPHP
ncbi:PREDICTED: cleavage and polyadenylation specificity factor subunit 6-like isoform X4 [Myotis brandtii]|uniref:cleavage and polyadenylation specificity factor subunit 6-like isoform X4 n=1 Tax=Myotis brandtii TaxID=109478 RepID=UPI0003BC058F|nr:PREDICTED: cleavage and polyadenylation specificity factor subunit 6-like isoform X4 [Myotis brandtii]